MRIIITFLVLLVWGIINCSEINALELSGVSLRPPIVSFTVKPGASFEQVFVINNMSSGPVKPELCIQDFYVEDEQWFKVSEPNPAWSPMTWATFVSKPVKLESMGQDEVIVRFDVPLNAETGEHVTYFSVKFVPVAADAQATNATGLTAISEIRAPIFVRVTDHSGNFNMIRGWELDNLGVNFWNFSHPRFILSALNTGNVHLQIQGKIMINDVLRNKRTEISLPRQLILPGAERELAIKWNNAPFIGYFLGNIQVTYDQINFEKREFHFIILPLLTTAGVLLFGTGIVLAVAFYIRKLRKRLIAAEQQLFNRSG